MGLEEVKVGWGVDVPFGDVVFKAPTPVKTTRSRAISNRAVQACPAVNDFEKRIYQIGCPFDIRLRLIKENSGIELYSVPEGTRLDVDLLDRFVMLMKPEIWRDSRTPVVQLSIPYFFICDEMCYVSQLPPYMDEAHRFWPGLMISGRFRTDVWPRSLNWAFEWTDLDQDLVLRRGTPLCYFQFEFRNPEARPQMVYAEVTPELREYRKIIHAAPKFTSGTFSLQQEAVKRRPKNLLKEMSSYEQ